MCRYTDVELTSNAANCSQAALGEAAHRWTRRTYVPCSRVRGRNRPCGNLELLGGTVQGLNGSSLDPCYVCVQYQKAEERYKTALDEAWEEYNRKLEKAEERRTKDYEAATLEEEDTVRYLVLIELRNVC
jgi:hypothetical protein